MKKNIVLIGYMGTGKSTIGKILSKELKMEFIDTDLLIEKNIKMSIKDIFENFGEKYFRDLESKIAKEVSKLNNKIISTGGGIVLRDENINNLKKTGMVVLLKANADTIYERVSKNSDRPLLNVENPKEKINKMLIERKLNYERFKDIEIETDNKTVNEIFEIIKENYFKTV
ncbi:shikimate kinase [Haliovirga abyssi]|uniref:Shikimate kinase n=1 Tax=Haliovirga abyssi TaxID=2996794 RepID=A0AAU9DDL9_9FUSO|nr:shikimate kinase [Haliovirga abyssi]BDU50432.1 shikimate kinase [Haliovirga abyssi]